MNILQINTKDIGGGAEKVAYNLFQSYRDRGHQSFLAVGYKLGNDVNVLEIPQENFHNHILIRFRNWLQMQNQKVPGTWRLSEVVDWVARPEKKWNSFRGLEDFNFPGTQKFFNLQQGKIDIIHAHNLHGSYFDLRILPETSKYVPYIVTLHDEWMHTGHCAYTFGCPRWEFGCGSCPDLQIYPPIKRDSTSWNWRRKKNIFQRSTLYIATPSHWLMDRVQRSILSPVEARVINNGVDLSIYHPENRRKVREFLGLPENAIIILFAALGVTHNPFKDYATIHQAVSLLNKPDFTGRSIILIALGSNETIDENIGRIKIKYIGFQSDPSRVAQYFQACDIYLHAAKAENFPNTIIEALACGTPVIATAVGGISEQIEDGVTGFLTPPGDADTMVNRIIILIQDIELRNQMGIRASKVAEKRFNLTRQVDEYLNWYQEILDAGKLQQPAKY